MIKTATLLLSLCATSLAFAPPRPTTSNTLVMVNPWTRLRMTENNDKGDNSSTSILEKVGLALRYPGEKEETESSTTPIEYMDEVKIEEQDDNDNDNDNDKTEEKFDAKNVLQKIKDSGKAGIISYALWETGFWALSLPLAVAGYVQFAGHWPDFQNQEDIGYLGAEAFAFVNFARFAVPLRIGLALSTVGWVQENIVDRFFPEEEQDKEESQ